ncbi:MAG: hypothetical protein JWP97_1314 [Labilithrix sp.]|nr:hypothetical protein [Labilithrix sp.]
MGKEGQTGGLRLALKVVAILVMVLTPLLGIWLASSLAAFGNHATWVPVAAGLLLFPGVPLLWEGAATLRHHGDARAHTKQRWLTATDRLALRTLSVNVVFLAVLLAAFPQRAFVALSARGDWMLDRRHGPAAESTRKALLTSAGALEWLYRAAHDNPYRRDDDHRADHENPTPTPTPTATATADPPPVPTASASASASPSASASASASASPTPTPAPDTAPLAYPQPATIHPLIAHLPPEAEASIETLGRYIAAREPDPVQRVKALHDWVVDRIAYDTPAYVAHRIPDSDRDARAVFSSRVGVCAGYASLLADLGKVTGDEIVYVVGDARTPSSPMEGEGHAWNAVKLHGQWYLIDPTWDAGSSDDTFHKEYQTTYLFTPPATFAISHFPDDAKWQLLEAPLTRAEFFRRPALEPAFFLFGLDLVTPDRSQVSVHDALDVEVQNPRGVFLLASYVPKQGGPKRDCTPSGKTRIHCDFPAGGTYDLHLYASTKEYGRYPGVGSLEVNVRP